eukprot:Protomagalhaensia_wolfi_Nauph_80__774@NODE_1447_length_1525_cov_500_048452_g1118_i0_p1_GENE_NODE_1447_length_1525_cov_500_048452_g1118_i0NODE_1447_length_1525_cov_500_048452_g1118_i0_p1_ORF_typecomplete_len186_score65_03GST_C_3/PF14497_6/2_2e05GST_N/PF02798_20/0_0004GST_N_3/PF13417_6/0_00041zfXS/PF03470_14/0_047Tom37/PF10568_9/0_04_NODE_1447_length_1525_cov_500_048452_g1118_i08791436
MKEWPEKKVAGFSPSKKLPMLDVDGKKFVESRAILTYVCALTGNIPSTPIEILAHNMLLEKIDEVWNQVHMVYSAKPEERAKALDEASTNCKSFFKSFNTLIKEHAGEPSHILKGKPYCPADLTIYSILKDFMNHTYGIDAGNIEQDYPAIYSIYKGVLDSNPRIKAYHLNAPTTFPEFSLNDRN